MSMKNIKYKALPFKYIQIASIGSSLIVALFIILSMTKWGIGIVPDSVSYISGARGIPIKGNLNSLGTHWPPLYFIVAAVSGLFHENLLTSLKWLQILLFVVWTLRELN